MQLSFVFTLEYLCYCFLFRNALPAHNGSALSLNMMKYAHTIYVGSKFYIWVILIPMLRKLPHFEHWHKI